MKIGLSNLEIAMVRALDKKIAELFGKGKVKHADFVDVENDGDDIVFNGNFVATFAPTSSTEFGCCIHMQKGVAGEWYMKKFVHISHAQFAGGRALSPGPSYESNINMMRNILGL